MIGHFPSTSLIHTTGPANHSHTLIKIKYYLKISHIELWSDGLQRREEVLMNQMHQSWGEQLRRDSLLTTIPQCTFDFVYFALYSCFLLVFYLVFVFPCYLLTGSTQSRRTLATHSGRFFYSSSSGKV